jgi:hypothetical protein
MAGAGAVKGKMTVTTPSKLRQPKTPSTSAKKRKIQEEASESDADDHFTEEETPTSKRKSAQHGGAFIGRGQKLGEGNKNGTGSGPKNSQRAGASNAMGVRIKTGICANFQRVVGLLTEYRKAGRYHLRRQCRPCLEA